MKLRETWVDTSVWRARRRRQAEEAVDAVGSVVAGSTKEVKATGETCLLVLAHICPRLFSPL